MEKWFNTMGVCVPEEHYMVDISNKLKEIKRMVDRKFYFTINRGRQYGKTTTLSELRKMLMSEYIVISLNFQGLGDSAFKDEESFCQEFLNSASDMLELSSQSEGWKNKNVKNFADFNRHLSRVCKDKKIVLMIDEVDQASNHRIFINFLDLLRTKYQNRAQGLDYTFHSVILVGVYDIKNIKLKMIQEGNHTLAHGESQENSPWNIAKQFKVEMAFSAEEIATMLQEYESYNQTGMDIQGIAQEIYYYTNGYPVLVTSICRYLDEDFDGQ